jgi:hypothetical protein
VALVDAVLELRLEPELNGEVGVATVAVLGDVGEVAVAFAEAGSASTTTGALILLGAADAALASSVAAVSLSEFVLPVEPEQPATTTVMANNPNNPECLSIFMFIRPAIR